MRTAKLSQPPRFQIAEQTQSKVVFSSDTGAKAHVYVLEEDIFRVVMLPDGEVKGAPSWAIAPGASDIEEPGRDRMSAEGFACPGYKIVENDGEVMISTGRLRLTVNLVAFHCLWEQKVQSGWRHMMSDRSTQSYNFGWWDDRVYHYIQRRPGERYYGLGEKSGPMNRAGRRFRFNNLDPMGYDAETSDPLYKTIPYILVADETNACFGMFYDIVGEMEIDLGQEMDNYHGHFRSMSASSGDLDLYVIAGPEPKSVTKRFTWMTGQPAIMPKWSLGYSGSTMTYTDAPNAQERQNEFLVQLEKHDIGCTSFHLSSGYTSIGAKRYVFNWNRDKFPDPAAFVDHYRSAGLELVPNIKPAFLCDHPNYNELAENGLFVSDVNGDPVEVQFWDELGSLIDFTNPAASQWWRSKLKEQLLDYGIKSTWNDNNEYGVWDSAARFNGFGDARPASEMRPVQPLLMCRASRTAQLESYPDERPYVVTRSGMTGLHRYAQTWSGDNLTEWKTIRFNAKMGLGLALSGVSNSGHDVGGFAGRRPDAELFIRWVQAGVLMPRFSIHSWNDDGSVNEPWMYPLHMDTISSLLKMRQMLVPLFDDLAWKYHLEFEPIIRPLWLEFPEDDGAWEDGDQHLIGSNLLVSLVSDPGIEETEVTLPGGSDWVDILSGKSIQGGRKVVLPAPIDGPAVMLARAGSALPVNLATGGVNPGPVKRGLLLFPDQDGGEFEWCFYESADDHSNKSPHFMSGQCQSCFDKVSVRIDRRSGDFGDEGLILLLPKGDGRTLQVENAESEPVELNGQIGLRVVGVS